MDQRQILLLHMFSPEQCCRSGYLRETELITFHQNDLSLPSGVQQQVERGQLDWGGVQAQAREGLGGCFKALIVVYFPELPEGETPAVVVLRLGSWVPLTGHRILPLPFPESTVCPGPDHLPSSQVAGWGLGPPELPGLSLLAVSGHISFLWSPVWGSNMTIFSAYRDSREDGEHCNRPYFLQLSGTIHPNTVFERVWVLLTPLFRASVHKTFPSIVCSSPWFPTISHFCK